MADVNLIGDINTSDGTYVKETGGGSSSVLALTESRVGIGTTSPDYKVHVRENSSNNMATIGLQSDTPALALQVRGSSQAGIFGAGNGAVELVSVGNQNMVMGTYSGTGNLLLGTNSTERMRIVAGGNVGIGVTDPDRKLEILDGGGNAQLKLSFDGTDNAELKVDTNGDLTITPSGTKVSVAGNLYATGSIIGGNGSDLGSSSNRYANLYMSSVLNYSNDLQFQASGTEKMRLTSGGLLGIGTSGPEHEINVAEGGASVSPSIAIDSYSTSGASHSHLIFRKSNSDTLGTKTQTDTNDFLGALDFYGVNGAATNVFALAASIRAEQDGAAGGVGTAFVPGCLYFETGDGNSSGLSTALYIDHNGDVGVGTTAPKSALHVGANAGGTGNGYLTLDVIGTTPTVENSRAGLFLRYNSSTGKDELCVKFSGAGAYQVIATQP